MCKMISVSEKNKHFPYGPDSIENDSGPSWKKSLGVLRQSIQFHPFLQMNICEGSEKISYMSKILGTYFFAYLDAGELPGHFAF